MSFWKRLFGIKDDQSGKPVTGHQTLPTPFQQETKPTTIEGAASLSTPLPVKAAPLVGGASSSDSSPAVGADFPSDGPLADVVKRLARDQGFAERTAFREGENLSGGWPSLSLDERKQAAEHAKRILKQTAKTQPASALSPRTDTTPNTQPTSTAMEVTFKREVRKQHHVMPNIETITRTYSAPNREAAVAFLLRKQNVTESFLYIEVVTPQGIFGIDKMGEVYDTGGEFPGDSSSLLDKPTPTTKRDTSQSNTPEWKALSQTFYDTAERGDLEKVKAMLKEHPNLVFSRISQLWWTRLCTRQQVKGTKDIVELLLDKGAECQRPRPERPDAFA